MIAIARSSYPKLAFMQRDILELSSISGTFDCLWVAYVMLHVPPDLVGQALRKLRDRLRPGGYIFFATTIASQSRFRRGPIAGLVCDGTELVAPTYEWSLTGWNDQIDGLFSEEWSELADFMSGKTTVLNAIYRKPTGDMQ
jgi:2-polyprenyl-3-methyl-5-hydroxy-6-metoxy-1,4-benzoquinol methylase